VVSHFKSSAGMEDVHPEETLPGPRDDIAMDIHSSESRGMNGLIILAPIASIAIKARTPAGGILHRGVSRVLRALKG